MPADILIENITNTTNTGIFDQLMTSVNTHIEKQYLENRITGADYSTVYLGSMQTVLQQAVQYVLSEQLTEAQIDGIAADNLIKAKQLEIAEQDLLIRQEELALKITESNRLRDTTEAELEKQWGYDVTRDVNGDLVLNAPTGEGKIDKDIELAFEQINLTQEQVNVTKEELALKITESNRLRDTTEAELEKQWGYDVSRDGVTGELILGATTGAGRVDKEIEKMSADIDVAQEQIAIAKAQASKEYVTMLASLDKELGYSYTLDVNGDVERSSITDTGDGKLDKEIEKITADINIANEQVGIAKAQASKEYVSMLASLDKEYGYDYTLDANDDVIRSSITDAGDGKLDAEIAKMQADAAIAQEQLGIAKTSLALEKAKSIASIVKEFGYNYTLDGDGNIVVGTTTGTGKLDYEIDLMVSQNKLVYTDRVLKDKQAAKLGLDNVMKLAEADRVSDPNYTYGPRYEEI